MAALERPPDKASARRSLAGDRAGPSQKSGAGNAAEFKAFSGKPQAGALIPDNHGRISSSSPGIYENAVPENAAARFLRRRFFLRPAVARIIACELFGTAS